MERLQFFVCPMAWFHAGSHAILRYKHTTYEAANKNNP